MPKILIIDDVQENLTIQSAILTGNIKDCVVITATSGKLGIEKAEKEQPDLILLDLMIPEIDGFEICKRLKESKTSKIIPVIMLTAVKIDTNNRVKGLNAGVDFFLTRPVETIELIVHVNVMLRIKNAEDLLRKEKDQLEYIVKKRTNSFQILSNCNRSLVHSHSELEFIQDICRIVVEQGEYKVAWVGFAQDDKDKTIYPIAYWGDTKCYKAVTKAKLTWEKDGIGLGPVGEAVRNGKCCIVHDVKKDPFFIKWREDALEQGCASAIALPVQIGEGAVGVLNVISDEAGFFVGNKSELLMELANDLAHGIKTFRLQVECAISSSALKNSEEQYHSLFNGVPVGIFRASADGRIIDANPELLKILGYSSMKELYPLDYRKTFFSDNEFERLSSEIGENGFVDNFETRIKDSSSKELWVLVKLNPINNHKGNIQYVEGTVEDITHRKQAEEHIHSLTQELIKAQENERSRIARDLHDQVAQNLGALKISCEALILDKLDITCEMKKNIQNFSDVLAESIASVRDIAYNLRPPNLDQLGLIVTIAQYCDDFMDRSAIMVDFFSAGMEKMKLDFDTEINLYRLIQEALSNIKKHSQAKNVIIRIVASSPDIILRIEDNGIGFKVNERLIESIHEKRMGLKSMEERVSLLKGTMTIKSRVGAGTIIVIKVKCTPANLNQKNTKTMGFIQNMN